MNLSKYLLPAIRVTLILAIFTGLFFPALVYGLAHLFFPNQAEGSLLRDKQGNIIGSHLIAQNFRLPQYFHPRPSAAGLGYDATASGGTNLGPTSKKLMEGTADDPKTASVNESFLGINQLAKIYRIENNLPANTKIPIDAVTRSASGLDPHISLQNALLQAPRVAKNRHLPLERMFALISCSVQYPDFGFLGNRAVNVLDLNLLMDESQSATRKIIVDDDILKIIDAEAVKWHIEAESDRKGGL